MLGFREHRTGYERELDKQNAILQAALALLDLGGTESQQAVARRACQMAESRRNVARHRVAQERER